MVSGGGNFICIKENVNLKNVKIEISGHDNTLIISEGVSFSDGGYIRIQDVGNKICIGKNTKVINTFFSAADKYTEIIVGEDCLFSNDIIVRSSDSHSIINTEGKRINNGKNVSIGNHVWVCNGVRIMKGTSISDNTVIGSNTIISGQKFTQSVLVVGSPAKVVRDGINWLYERI